jgi:hypothetical protein
MNANEWLGVIQKASDFPKGMEKLIIKYGQMLLIENKTIEQSEPTIPVSKVQAEIDYFEHHLNGGSLNERIKEIFESQLAVCKRLIDDKP